MNKTRFSEDIDIKIKEYLNNKAEEVLINEDMFNKIQGGITMKKINRKFTLKTGLIAAAICIATTATCIGAVKGGIWVSSSSEMNELSEMPSESLLNDKVGFIPKYVDSFEGGFKFNSFNFSEDTYNGKSGDEKIEVKRARFTYTKNNTNKDQILSLSAEKMDEELFEIELHEYEETPHKYKGCNIYYYGVNAKYVPEDYKINTEEEELINKGLLTISYGTDEVQEINNKSVCWYKDGIRYSILNMGYDDISKEQMIKMAKNVIDK